MLPNISASHSGSLPRCSDNPEYNKYLKYADTSHQHQHLVNHESSPNVALDTNQNYHEHLQPYFPYSNYPSHVIDSQQHSFMPYEKSEYMNASAPPTQSIDYSGHDSYIGGHVLHGGDMHRYPQTSPNEEHSMMPTPSIAPMSSPSPPSSAMIPTQVSADGVKTDEEFSGILANVRKTCFSS